MTVIRPGPVVLADIAANAGIVLDEHGARSVSGGSIHSSWRMEGGASGRWFVKLCAGEQYRLLEAEADGLAAIARTGTIRVPACAGWGRTADTAWLLLEFITFEAGRSQAAARLGVALAALHGVHGEHHGWHADNAIGLTAQVNAPLAGWTEFFRDRRLAFQFGLAQRNGYGGSLAARGEKLLANIGSLLAGHEPAPSLLHGDLWGGNWGVAAGGEPVIFDPAVYYGDREADIAMTRLFGGFEAAFYNAYHDALPVPDGADLRSELYNLYHVLNHLNLFGGGYLGQAHTIIDRLLAACGH